jgi:hypothetical protein
MQIIRGLVATCWLYRLSQCHDTEPRPLARRASAALSLPPVSDGVVCEPSLVLAAIRDYGRRQLGIGLALIAAGLSFAMRFGA